MLFNFEKVIEIDSLGAFYAVKFVPINFTTVYC